MKYLTALLITMILISNSYSQTVISLYRDSIPNAKDIADEEKSDTDKNGILRISKVSRPTLTVYFPPKDKATGAAVIICPGGGYRILAASHEGYDVAKRFNEMGIAAFVLKYRIPDDQTMVNKEIGPLQDAQRAIQLVRENAKKWRIDEHQIGIMGFSAGGHLASSAGTHFEQSYIENNKKISLRPDFLILVYPVISFNDSIGHTGSRDQLLGKSAPAEKITQYSNQTRVTSNTPPTFLVHAKDDPVKAQNSLVFAQALEKNNVPFKIHLYEKGGHGYGMNNPTSEVKWMDLVELWMKEREWLKKKN
jgi:acetyl esterase/lipase